MAKCFFVEFANGQTAYYPGQTISGRLVLQLNESVRCRAVQVTIHGEAYVMVRKGKWFYIGRDYYLNHRLELWTAPPVQESLPTGVHQWSFSFTIPRRLPSSFEYDGGCLSGVKGYIRYWVAANVVRPWRSDIKAKVPFTVVQYIDINHASLLNSMNSQNEKQMCCCCCASDPLSISSSVDRIGYCPGEKITVSARAENHSGREMAGIRVALRSVTTFFPGACSPTQRMDTICEKENRRPIPPGGNDSWQAVQIDIPPLPPTITNSRLVSRHYIVQVEIQVPRGLDLETYFPIIIGSVPFKESSQVTRVVAIDSRVTKRPQLDVPAAACIMPAAMPRFQASNQVVNVADDDAPVYPYPQASGRIPSVPPSFNRQPLQDARDDQPLLRNYGSFD